MTAMAFQTLVFFPLFVFQDRLLFDIPNYILIVSLLKFTSDSSARDFFYLSKEKKREGKRKSWKEFNFSFKLFLFILP